MSRNFLYMHLCIVCTVRLSDLSHFHKIRGETYKSSVRNVNKVSILREKKTKINVLNVWFYECTIHYSAFLDILTANVLVTLNVKKETHLTGTCFSYHCFFFKHN